jgi:hypothetical protein
VFPGNALLCGIRFAVPAVTPVAGHGGEGDQQEPRPGRSGCRLGPRSASRSGPGALLLAPRQSGRRLRSAGRARREHPGPGSRSSPSAQAGRPRAPDSSSNPWPRKNTRPGSSTHRNPQGEREPCSVRPGLRWRSGSWPCQNRVFGLSCFAERGGLDVRIPTGPHVLVARLRGVLNT